MQGTVLALHKDIGLLFAVAVALENDKIGLIPAASVKQAHLLMKELSPRLDVLIIECRIRGVCRFADGVRERVPDAGIVGVLSESHDCGACRNLLTATLRADQANEVQRWASVIRTLVRRNRENAKAAASRMRTMTRRQG